ncbi:MAG TPA: type II toxin-antitoxin system HigB family toxin [Candidatus Acidoferrales bacterium]|nr:type II toxin-antitoxin system HigB family toxin [Candidatus Acidoferrales bacterium]
MQIIGRKKITEAASGHADWRASLRSWVKIVEGADWCNLSDVQQTFNTADPVGRYVVFNIAGNKARLIAIVDFDEKQVLVKQVLKHDSYDRKDFAK